MSPKGPGTNVRGHSPVVVESQTTPPTFPDVHYGDNSSPSPHTAAEDHMIICLFLSLEDALQDSGT